MSFAVTFHYLLRSVLCPLLKFNKFSKDKTMHFKCKELFYNAFHAMRLGCILFVSCLVAFLMCPSMPLVTLHSVSCHLFQCYYFLASFYRFLCMSMVDMPS